jgi:hypothetical protein
MKTKKELLIYLASLIVTGELLSYTKQYASDIGAEFMNEELMLMNLQMRELWYLTKVEYIN